MKPAFIPFVCIAFVTAQGCSSGLEADLAVAREQLMQTEQQLVSARSERDTLEDHLAREIAAHKKTATTSAAASAADSEDSTTKVDKGLAQTVSKVRELDDADSMALEQKEAQIAELRKKLDVIESQLAQAREKQSKVADTAITAKQKEIRQLRKSITKSEDLLENALNELDSVLKEFPSNNESKK